MRRSRTVLTTFVCFAIAACGNSGKETGLGDSPTPEDAISRLPEETQAAFAAWKAQPIKTCSLDAAFPGFEADPNAGPSTMKALRGVDANS